MKNRVVWVDVMNRSRIIACGQQIVDEAILTIVFLISTINSVDSLLTRRCGSLRGSIRGLNQLATLRASRNLWLFRDCLDSNLSVLRLLRKEGELSKLVWKVAVYRAEEYGCLK